MCKGGEEQKDAHITCERSEGERSCERDENPGLSEQRS